MKFREMLEDTSINEAIMKGDGVRVAGDKSDKYFGKVGVVMVAGKGKYTVQFADKERVEYKEKDLEMMPMDETDKDYEEDPKLVKLASQLEKLTKSKKNTESYIEVAKFLGATKWVNVLEHILGITDELKYLPTPISKYRHSIYQDLIRVGEQKYGEKFNIVYNAL
jgi:mannitol-specific phosphotransferase system IIBC component